jgi:hypothetical protein
VTDAGIEAAKQSLPWFVVVGSEAVGRRLYAQDVFLDGLRHDAVEGAVEQDAELETYAKLQDGSWSRSKSISHLPRV